MFWTLVATVFCGLGAAGIALGIRALTRQRAPKWLIPAFAGLGMLGYLVYGEYIWFDHKRTLLPEEAVIVDTESEGILWRPWTFVFPYVTAFSAVDKDSFAYAPNNPEVVRFTLYRFNQKVTDAISHRVHLLNCDTRELVPLNSEGSPSLDNMKVLDSGDTLLKTVCNT